MTIIKRVSEAEALGEDTPDPQHAADDGLRSKNGTNDGGTAIVMNIPAGQLTRLRLEVREAEYGNHHSED